MENSSKTHIRYREAERRMKKIKGFYTHAMVYFFVNIFIIGAKARFGSGRKVLGMGFIEASAVVGSWFGCTWIEYFLANNDSW